MSPLLPSGNATDLVTFKVLIGGVPVETQFAIRQLTVIREVNRIPVAKLVIADGDPSSQDFAASGSEFFIPGNEIEIKAGYHSEDETIFKGIITSQGIKADVRRPSSLTVDCKGKAFKMTIGRKNRTFPESTDSDAISTILSEHGLQSDVESTAITHESLLQYNATDWDFIVLRAEACNKLVFAEDDVLKIKAPAMTGPAVIEASYGSGMLGFEGEIRSEEQYSSVKAHAWDPSAQETIEMEGTDPGISQPGNLSPSTLAAVSGLDEFSLRHPAQVKDQVLQSWSDSVLTRSQLARNRGRVTVQGTAEPKPGDLITLSGLGDRYNGDAWISGIRHEISEGNWTTNIGIGLDPEPYAIKHQADLQAPPAAGLMAAVHGLQTGVVTQIHDDPEMEFRVKVELPLLNGGQESVWARMATLDAGNNRGTFFYPEIGDEVLVGFLNDDPQFPVIIGLLHSSANAAPSTPSDGNHEKGFVSRSGMKVWFNDEDKTIEISTSAGNKIFISEKDKSIEMTDQNGNKIKMSQDGISLESVKDIILKATGDLKAEGINVELKANSQFKASGSAGAEVSASGSTVIKGAVVQIN
jgi:Rhs element Vgr protein